MTGRRFILTLLLLVFAFAAGAYALMNIVNTGIPVSTGPAPEKKSKPVSETSNKVEPSARDSKKSSTDGKDGNARSKMNPDSPAKTAKVSPSDVKDAESKSKESQPELNVESTRTGQGNQVQPTIDVVRVDPSGNAVLAGRSEPGWTIRIESEGKVLGQVKADSYGEWVIIPDNPLSAGKKVLDLRAISPTGTVGVNSTETITVVVKDKPTDKQVASDNRGKESSQDSSKGQSGTGKQGAKSETGSKTLPADKPSDTELAAKSNGAELAKSGKPAVQQQPDNGKPDPASNDAASRSSEKAGMPHGETATKSQKPKEMKTAETGETQPPANSSGEVDKGEVNGSSGVTDGETTFFGRIKDFFAGAGQDKPDQKKPDQSVSLVTFDSVDYLSGTDKSGRFVLSGSALPGMRVRVYLDNKFVGAAKVGDAGNWVVSEELQLPAGVYSLVAEQIDSTGTILSRAELPFERHQKEQVKIAAADAADKSSSTSETAQGQGDKKASKSSTVVAAETEQSGQEGLATVAPGRNKKPSKAQIAGVAPNGARAVKKSRKTKAKKYYRKRKRRSRRKKRYRKGRRYVVVRRGDSLWEIAERYYGRGKGYRYRRIYRSNRSKIRYPDLIYPRQRFKVP